MAVRRLDRGDARADTADIPTLLLLGGAFLCAFFGAYQLLETYFLVPLVSLSTLHLLHVIRGIVAALLLGSFAVWYTVRHPAIAERPSSAESEPVAVDWRAQQLHWFIQMRWIAAGLAIALIVIAVPLSGLLAPRHLPQLLACWILLVGANLYFSRAMDQSVSFETQVIVQSVVDLLVLTGMLNASGGIENPLSVAYLFHVIIGGILLPKRKAIGMAIFASAVFSSLAFGEMLHAIPHATILLFPHSHTMTGGHLHIHHAAHDMVFVTGRVVPFVGVMLLTAYFTTLITERLHQSEATVEANARNAVLSWRRLERVIDAGGLGIAILRQDLTIDWLNQRLAGWLGWNEAAGSECPHDHEEGRGCFACAASDTFSSGNQNETEMALPAPGGGTRYFRSVISPVLDADGNIAQVVAVVEEVTARKVLEAEALHAGRLSVLGQLAAGIAHEIGNPLSSLHARLQLMKRSAEPDFHHDSLHVLQTQIDRISRIVRNVSHLAQNHGEGWQSIDMNSVVSEAMALVKMDSRSAGVDFSEDLSEPLPAVHGVRDQLLQVMLNLILNAVEAMPAGGTLATTTSSDRRHVKVAVSDSGPGISDAVRARVFEPFFTTKREGTGLGLSICYSLVHAHGGSIAVDSGPGGSCFTVDLPIAVPKTLTPRAKP